MVTNISFEEQLRKLISESQDELNKIESQIKTLQDQQASLAEELHSYEYTLNNYLKRIGKGEKESEPKDWIKLLGNLKTHKQKILAIAEHNSGKIKLNSIVDILYNSNFIKSKSRSNAYVQLYNIVMEMVDKGELEKTSRGRYRIPKNRLL
jgi:septal ring factor EnvC (AmiA/AmiB activator)